MRYIGSKILLLDNIKQVIDENIENANTFCDIFSGTSCVARYFKSWYKIYSNDLLYFSYVLQKGTVENNSVPLFKNIIKVLGKSPIKFLNELPTECMEELEISKRFCQNNYSPKGGRMYMTEDNALRIDFCRNKIEEWKKNNLVNEYEYFYLLASLIEGVPFISNISGTYGAYHKTWDKRAFKEFKLIELDIIMNEESNKSFNEDGTELLKRIEGDILYIDPPYNNRQYLPNYHVLETIAKYDFPELKGVTGQRKEEYEKSKFCSKKTVKDEFIKTIKNANFRYIILSYSSDGLISVEEIEKILKEFGKIDTYKRYEIPYRRYKSRNTTNSVELKEYLFYIEKEVRFDEIH